MPVPQWGPPTEVSLGDSVSFAEPAIPVSQPKLELEQCPMASGFRGITSVVKGHLQYQIMKLAN
jgi:hypothetical protein